MKLSFLLNFLVLISSCFSAFDYKTNNGEVISFGEKTIKLPSQDEPISYQRSQIAIKVKAEIELIINSQIYTLNHVSTQKFFKEYRKVTTQMTSNGANLTPMACFREVDPICIGPKSIDFENSPNICKMDNIKVIKITKPAFNNNPAVNYIRGLRFCNLHIEVDTNGCYCRNDFGVVDFSFNCDYHYYQLGLIKIMRSPNIIVERQIFKRK
jgi:hypothetical protein